MSVSEERASEERLEVQLECCECGASFVAGVWDHSFRCSYCGSVLACTRTLGEEVFAVSDGGQTARDAIELLIRSETESFRNAEIGRAKERNGGASNGIPVWIEAQVAALRAKLENELSLIEAGDFLVPYELHERTVFQGILGRRGDAKESVVQSLRTEDVRRRYDATRYNLRDRGLKLRGTRLALLRDAHLERVGGHALQATSAASPEAIGDRARVQVDPGLELISRLESVTGERALRVWKQMGYAKIQRGAAIEGHLFDRQFGTIAGRLEPSELEALCALPARALDEVLQKPVLRAIASECPNCGAELALSPRARIAFCKTCGQAMHVSAEGFTPLEYELAAAPPAQGRESLLGYPFWAFELRLRAGGREFTRLWDWLEQVSPQPAAARYRETDPAQARLFLPARATFGTRGLDDAFAALAAVASWRQPETQVGRPQPGDGLELLDVELEPEQVTALARFALVALHDRQSTRKLNGATFQQWVGEAQLALSAPSLVVVPLELYHGQWLPAGPAQADHHAALLTPFFPLPVSRALLADAGQIARRSHAFALP